MSVKTKNIIDNPVYREDEAIIEISKEEYLELNSALNTIEKYKEIAFHNLSESKNSEWQQISYKLNEKDLTITIKSGMIG